MKLKIKKALLLLKYLLIKRYPCVLQSDENDCGSAAFATIAKHYGYHMNLEQACELVQVHQMGQSVWDLKDAAEDIGLEGRPAHAIYSAIKQVEWPFIAHYGGELAHFVVVYEVHDNYVVVGDPASGIEIQSREEFEKKWSGYIVEFEPTDKFKKTVIAEPAHKLFWRIIVENRALIRFIIVLSFILSFISIASSYFVKVVIDTVLPGKRLDVLGLMATALIIIYLVQLSLQIFRAWLQATIGNKIERTRLLQYLEHLAFLPLRYHETRSGANLYNRLTDIERIRFAASNSLISLFSDCLFMIVALFVMVLNSPALTVLVLGFIPVLLIIIFAFGLPIRRMQGLTMGRMGEVASRFFDMLSGISEIKIFSAEQHFIGRIREKTDDYIRSTFNLNILQSFSYSLGFLIVSLLTVALLWKGAHFVTAGEITLGQMMFFFSLVAFVVSPIQRSMGVFFGVQDALVAIERVQGIADIRLEKEVFSGKKQLVQVRGKIEFQHVTFGYNRRQNVLDDISFSVNPGEICAIVGETGVGKSTLIKLICGFYKIDSGTICIDDISLNELSIESLRENICAVFQRPHLFSESLYKNIVMDDDTPVKELEERFKAIPAFQFIEQLPQKYLSQVFCGGSNFSEGQIQRIAILRAITRNSPLLIFDEATSNLDSETEKIILNLLKKEREGKTTIIVGHRISTIALADKIIVLDKGKIAETGGFKELIARHGQFYNLFRAQLEAKESA
ncbi:peptidase domain-containing ABC transporter [Candidatus Omnitrophota bacterium]